MTFGDIFGAQSGAKHFVGFTSLFPQVLSFWLLPGFEMGPSQPMEGCLEVPGRFLENLWFLGGPCSFPGGRPTRFVMYTMGIVWLLREHRGPIKMLKVGS